MKLFFLILKNLRRNLLRTILTTLGTMVLVLVVTLVWSVLDFLDRATEEKSQNLKVVVSERWQLPSQMPFAYASTLVAGGAREPGDARPVDTMTWQFFIGSLDPVKRSRDDFVFAIALEPRTIATMMDELEDLTGEPRRQLLENIKKMDANRQAIVMGPARLKAINKRVGDRITVHGINFRDLNLELEIVGLLPDGRYDQTSLMNRDYLNEAIDNYPRTHQGAKHAMAEKSLNLVWLRVSDRDAFERVAEQIMSSPLYTSPAVKCETQSSGISAFLDAYRDIIWAMRWILSPAILVTLSLVIANSISISVRERRLEMAVLKVLGFRPAHLLALVLGEAVLLGALSGLASGGATYYVVNEVFGGLKFPIAFFPAFLIPLQSIGWGLAIGTATALAGSVLPAWNARTVKVSEVFAKVA